MAEAASEDPLIQEEEPSLHFTKLREALKFLRPENLTEKIPIILESAQLAFKGRASEIQTQISQSKSKLTEEIREFVTNNLNSTLKHLGHIPNYLIEKSKNTNYRWYQRKQI